MNYSEIKQIMKDMEKSSLAELSIEFPDGTKISVKNQTEEIVREVQATPKVAKEVVQNDIPKVELEGTTKDDGLKVVTSPMVGTFYAKPSPTAKPFVEVGKKVKTGETLCIIEAMKLMNEIESEYDGEIAEILVKDGEMVDYGKPLFKMRLEK